LVSDEAARVDNDARAERALAAALEALGPRAVGIAAEEAAHELFHGGIALATVDAGTIDVHDRRRRLLHRGDKGKLDLRLRLRNAAQARLGRGHARAAEHGRDKGAGACRASEARDEAHGGTRRRTLSSGRTIGGVPLTNGPIGVAILSEPSLCRALCFGYVVRIPQNAHSRSLDV
jgi:hypothetical protein